MDSVGNPFEGQHDALPAPVARAGFSQHSADLDGVTLHYVRSRRRGGVPLVMVPAQMGTWRTYAGVLPALAAQFEVFAVDVRGHGNSSWTPGGYCWSSVGGDLGRFLERVVGRPAVVAGNSSGGIIALWCAANVPVLVRAIVLEDAPVFSAEMPRFAERDRFVHQGLRRAVEVLERPDRRLADYLRGQVLPVSRRREKRVPDWLVGVLDRRVRRYEAAHPGQPSGVAGWWFPAAAHELIRSLSMFDPDFARAFVDGRFYEQFSHEQALTTTDCPILLLHGRWLRTPEHGLVGAMDDEDARRVRHLAPQTRYVRIAANHVIHRYRPRQYVHAVARFAAGQPGADDPRAEPGGHALA